MRRKSFFLGVGILVLLGSSVGSVLAFLVRHEPQVYQQHEPPPGQERRTRSDEFLAESAHLTEQILNKRQWQARFTDEQINSYLQEDFLRSGVGEKTLPEGITEPRVAIEPDKIRLAFRYGNDSWSTVISIDLRVWLAPREPNVVVLELQALRAGSLPISAQSLLDRVADAARQHNMELTWYRHNGNPVALLRFQPYQSRPTFHLQRLDLSSGTIQISGRATDAVPAADATATVARPEAE